MTRSVVDHSPFRNTKQARDLSDGDPIAVAAKSVQGKMKLLANRCLLSVGPVREDRISGNAAQNMLKGATRHPRVLLKAFIGNTGQQRKICLGFLNGLTPVRPATSLYESVRFHELRPVRRFVKEDSELCTLALQGKLHHLAFLFELQ